MIFVDYLGNKAEYPRLRDIVASEVATGLRVAASEVKVRRIVTEDAGEDVELWIELSSEEQLYRLGSQMAQGITDGARAAGLTLNVWVMYRLVPLSHAFLNGEPRGRGTPIFE